MSDDSLTSKLRRTKGSVVRPSTEVALSKLGKDIEFARRVRGFSADKFADAVGISRSTLHRLESGDGAGISLNTLAKVLTVLGKLDLLTNLIDIRNDDIGLSLLREQVMEGTRQVSKTEKNNIESPPQNVRRASVRKRSPGAMVTTKPAQSVKKQPSRVTQPTAVVVSPSGRTSSLLSRLKAKRDTSGS